MPSSILSILARPAARPLDVIPAEVIDAAPAARADAPLPVLGDGVLVPLADGTEVEYAALDYAASAPALRRVWDDVAEYLPYYGSVHRGNGHLSRLSTELYETSRAEVARFLGCRPDDKVVFTRSTTDSLNLLASALPAGTEVFVFETEHHAALLPWGTREDCAVTYLSAPRSPREAVRILTEALTVRRGDGPALVCVTGASNVTGELWPVRELADAAHRLGARLVLDAAQLAPHHPVDITELGADWVAFSGHKFYAPFGAGVLAGRWDWLRAAAPYLAGGSATRSVTRDADGRVDVVWNEDDTSRHEAGSPNVVGAYAIASACRALRDAGPAALAARERRLAERVLTGLRTVPGARVLSLFGDDAERVGVISFVVDGHDNSRIARELSDRYGIGIREGLFCAHPLVRLLTGCAPDAPAECGAPGEGEAPLSAIRVSFGAGTPDEHVERFLTAIAELTR